MSGVHVDLRVLTFATVAAIVTGMLFGLAPALSLSRLSSAAVLRADARQIIAGRGAFQRSLIAIELALSFLLLIAPGCFRGASNDSRR
jgi:hypothetical protein